MTPDYIASLAASGKSEGLDFKSNTGARYKAARSVCAMLNQRGGHILFGVLPNGQVAGQQIDERKVELLKSEFQQIDPPALPCVERVRIPTDLEVVVVQVGPGASPPYRYRGESYLRVGNTTQSMPSEECNRLIFERMHKEHRWENQTVDGFTVDDLDIEEIQNTVAEAVSIGRLNEPASRNAEDMLRALGLLQHGRLTRAAMVLFGRAERLESELPQCSVRVARFRGVDRSEVLDNRQIYGNAFSQLSSAMRFLSEWLPLAVRLEFRVWVH